MKVKIVAHTPEPEKVISMAAKLCYSKVGVDGIEENLTEEKIEKFLNHLMEIGHQSPLEHTSFTFAVEGISRVVSHQLVRHRLASFSQQSQRYVNLEGTFEYITPQSIKEIPFIKGIYDNAMNQAFENYVELSKELLICKVYRFLVEDLKLYSEDVCQDEEFMMEIMKTTYKDELRKFEKESIEDARYVLPNACETKMVFTMNIRSLLNFLKLRCCNRAQEEIRELADEMLKQCKEIAPILFKNAGAECIRGKCPEGAMTCGNPKK